MESGVSVYSELSTGTFLFRVGDQLTASDRDRYHATSRATLDRILDRDPPGAIYLTDEEELEAPFLAYARRNGYLRVAGKFGGGSLWVRPLHPASPSEPRTRELPPR